jgi:hypothetical protein
MKRVLALAAIQVLFIGSVLAAQAKPSFVGKWTLTSDPAGDFMISPALSVVEDAKTLTVTTNSQFGESKTVYNVDGTEGKSPLEFGGNTMDRTTKSAWDGNKLVLTTKLDFGGMPFEVKQVWSLGADGVLTMETTRPDMQGGGGPVTTKATYKKG